jgi:hypothetical protein
MGLWGYHGLGESFESVFIILLFAAAMLEVVYFGGVFPGLIGRITG